MTSPTAAFELDDEGATSRALFSLIDKPAPGPGPGNMSGAAHTLRWQVQAGAYGRGPWDHGLLHGGPVCGLAGWASEHLGSADGLRCARLTVEILRPVPVDALDVSATTAKNGRRARVVDVEVSHQGRLVARASTQWLQASPGWAPSVLPEPPGRPPTASDPSASELAYPRPGFNCDAAELRFVRGSTEESGPGTVWTRLTSPLMAGERPSPLVRIATLSDLAAAAGWEAGPEGSHYINPDLTLQLANTPRGAWVCFDAASHRIPHGLGFIETTVYDDGGPIGRVLQSLVRSPTDLATGTTGGKS